MYCIDLYWENIENAFRRLRGIPGGEHALWMLRALGRHCQLRLEAQEKGPNGTGPDSSVKWVKWVKYVVKDLYHSLPFFTILLSLPGGFLQTLTRMWKDVERLGIQIFNGLQVWLCLCCFDLCLCLYFAILAEMEFIEKNVKLNELRTGIPMSTKALFARLFWTFWNILEPFLEKSFIKGEVQHSLTQFSAPRLWQGSC